MPDFKEMQGRSVKLKRFQRHISYAIYKIWRMKYGAGLRLLYTGRILPPVLPATALYPQSSSIAPRMEVIHPAVYPGPPHSARPMSDPINAPSIPMSAVTMTPPGSRPGINNFAIMPTTSPKSI
jgi:hypothetical protein